MRPGRNDETQVTFDADQLASQLQLLDALHNAASEERLPQLTALPEEGLKAWLAEMQYLASETLAEIERHAACKAPPKLRLLRGSAGKRRRPAI